MSGLHRRGFLKGLAGATAATAIAKASSPIAVLGESLAPPPSRMLLSSNGFVGYGTAAPSARLWVRCDGQSILPSVLSIQSSGPLRRYPGTVAPSTQLSVRNGLI